MEIKKILLQVCVSAAIILGAFASGNCQSSDLDKPRLVIFHSLACHSCIKVIREIIPQIEKKYKDRISLEYRDVDDVDNYTFLLSLQEKYNVTIAGSLPVLYMAGHFINGYEDIKSGWEGFIAGSLGPPPSVKCDVIPEIDLISRFKRFTPALIIGVGFVDGLNPCALTVIVFFISFMAVQGYKKRELLGIGSCFIFAVFLTYLLIGVGALGFFYRFNQFWLLVTIINYLIGSFSIILGILTVHDIVIYKKTGQTEGLFLQLPKILKNQIHKVIGLFGRVTDKATGRTSEAKFSYKLIVSAFITGFIVTLLEAVCTGQAYIPTISFILKTSSLKIQALGYLLLFNLMFVVPLILILMFSIFGVTSERFGKFMKKYLLIIKILMAAAFFGLGIFLIWRA